MPMDGIGVSLLKFLVFYATNFLGAKSGYFFLGFDIAFFIYLYFYLPETRNRTTAEIEYLFQKKVPCRKFKGYDIDREYSISDFRIFFRGLSGVKLMCQPRIWILSYSRRMLSSPVVSSQGR